MECISNLDTRIQALGKTERLDPVYHLSDVNAFDGEDNFIESSKLADAKRVTRREARNADRAAGNITFAAHNKKAFNDDAFYGKSKKAYKAFLMGAIG